MGAALRNFGRADLPGERIMASLIVPPQTLKRWIRRRRRSGLDRYDEVWDGVYVMSPIANIEHQGIGTQLSSAFIQALPESAKRRVLAGANVSDRGRGWTKNYRVPDVVVYLPDNPAIFHEAYAQGGPDFAVEVISKGDRSRDKFDFYKKVGVRELLLVDRYPWRLELFRNTGTEWIDAGSLSSGDSGRIVSEVLPVSFRLIEVNTGPKIEVTHSTDGRVWNC